MGKSTKSRKSKVCRDDPIGLDSAVIELELKTKEMDGQNSQPENVDNMMAQLQSVNPEDRVCGCHSLARLSLASPQFRQVALDRKVARVCGPLALDTDPMVRLAAVGALNNLSSVDPDIAEILVEQDIMTPLAAMISTFYPSDWTPNITTAKSKKIDMLTSCLAEALGLLWNLVESSQAAVNMFNNHNLVHTVIRYLDITVFPITLVQAALSVLATVCDNNLPASEVVLSRESILLSILQSDNISMLARVTSGVVLLNIHRTDIYNQTGCLAGIVSTVSQCLIKDVRLVVCQFSSNSPLEENEEMETEGVGEKTEDSEECRILMKSQEASLEVLVNLTGLDDTENDWIDDEENMSDENEEFSDENNDSIKLSEVNPAYVEIVVANNLVEIILSKANDVPENVRDILVSTSRGRKLYEHFQELRTRALLCVSCLTDNLTKSDLGGVERLQQIWTELGRLSFSPDVREGEFIEAATGAMRSVTRRICSENLEEARELIGVLGAEDLAGMMATYSNSQSSGVRVNIVNIIGDIAGLAATNIKEPASCQVLSQLITWIEETGSRDQDLRVVAESLDKLMDVLSEDDSDELFSQMKLLAKLKQLLPSVKIKMEQQRKSLGDNFPIVQMAKTNLQRFIKYKEKRPLIAMSCK